VVCYIVCFFVLTVLLFAVLVSAYVECRCLLSLCAVGGKACGVCGLCRAAQRSTTHIHHTLSHCCVAHGSVLDGAGLLSGAAQTEMRALCWLMTQLR
jgi:hypothetical protein